MNHESDLLKKWVLDTPAPASFNSAVWRRIEERRRVTVSEAIGHWMNELFAKPAVSLAYLGLTVAIGLAAAQVQSSKVLRERDGRMEARYVQSVDPYALRVTK